METISELEALRIIDDALTKLNDAVARERVLAWASNKFAGGSLTKAATPPPKPTSGGASKKSKPKTKASLSTVKDLNLKPQGKSALSEVVEQKMPKSDRERCTLAVYYLKNELGLSAVSANHVYTAFKHMRWRMPASLVNCLQYTASHDNWLDTADMENIRVTPMGENLVEHDLPAKPTK